MNEMTRQDCRWWDACMDCCRHPHTYEWMLETAKATGTPFFAEYRCTCKHGCGYQKIAKNRPRWDEEE